MSERNIRNDPAITAEISRRGLVLPVSGNKEKMAAAARAGLKREGGVSQPSASSSSRPATADVARDDSNRFSFSHDRRNSLRSEKQLSKEAICQPKK